jgi:hypothetical protein
MRGEQWRALRRGLAFQREQRDMTVERWLDQLGVAEAAPELPPLARLLDSPAPRQWPQRVAAAAMVLFSVGLAAFAVDRQSGVDWQQVLAGVRHSWDNQWEQLLASVPWVTDAAPAAAPVRTATLPPSAAAPAVAAAATRDSGVTLAARSPVATVRIATPSAAATRVAASAGTAAPGTAAPRVEFAASSYDVAAGEPAARIEVRRTGSREGDMSFIWWTEAASAQPDVDYAELGRRIEKIPSGTDRITLFVPIISNPQRGEPSRFYVALADTGGGGDGSFAPDTRAAVTIDRGE